MKTSVTQIALTLALLAAFNSTQAGTIYNINSNSNWSAVLPATCANCTINIAAGKTLTIDKNVVCQVCTISGGTITTTNFSMQFQYIAAVAATTFTGVSFVINGTGSITANAPLSLTNSTFTFNNTSSLTTSYQVDLVNSKINLNDTTTMTANGPASTKVNLSAGSQINIGNGKASSKSSLLMNGPTLNIYDDSNVTVGNVNNNYMNWASFNTSATPAGVNKSYSTSNNNLNCGGSGQNSCANPNMYGPGMLSAAGAKQGITTLPVILVGFSAELNSNNTVNLIWDTKEEENASHFDIERSTNGADWTTVGAVHAKGNSSSTTNYSFTDESPVAGADYYRLRMVDLDGAYGYTEVKVVRTSSLVNKVSFYPNPATNYVNVSLAGEATATSVTVRLMNQAGQVMQEKKVDGANGTVTFPVQQYAAGMYILSVSSADGSHESSKILISRS